jgi:hypothetical protein
MDQGSEYALLFPHHRMRAQNKISATLFLMNGELSFRDTLSNYTYRLTGIRRIRPAMAIN